MKVCVERRQIFILLNSQSRYDAKLSLFHGLGQHNSDHVKRWVTTSCHLILQVHVVGFKSGVSENIAMKLCGFLIPCDVCEM